MKKILYTILAAAVILVANYFFSNGTFEANVETPTPGVVDALPESTAIPAVSFMDTSFTIPAGLASGTKNEIVPQIIPDPTQGGMDVWPAHTKITLQGYPLQATLRQPEIRVFPADEYQKMSGDPETSMYDARTMITTLQVILATGAFPPSSQIPDRLPLLPDPHARQVFHAQETILSFKNGNGIRYITQFSQAAMPAIGSDMAYIFQGITLDGKYYVSVIMPINVVGLNPAPDSVDQYPNYLNTTVERLHQPGNTFTPSLETLDVLVQSLTVNGAPVSEAASTAPDTSSSNEEWVTNVGRLHLKRTNSAEVTATMDGYGELARQDTLQGTLNGNVATLNSQLLGDLKITFSGDIFKTTDGSRVAFCGVRASVSEELPAGCGFSGKWILSANSFFPGSSYAVLTQTANNVTGDFYDGKGNRFDSLTGQVSWGKGWWLGGVNEKGHTITLMINPFETGFEYIYDDLYQLKLCAMRDGLSSADLGNFVCK